MDEHHVSSSSSTSMKMLDHLFVSSYFVHFMLFMPIPLLWFLFAWIRRPVNQVKHLADKRLRPKSPGSHLPPIYPNGWIPVAESRSVTDCKPIESIVCGNQVVLYRRQDQSVTCLDAFCPHLGANLAYGGQIEKHENDNCLRCPFHGWKFNADGVCVQIPYSNSTVPKGIKIRQWQCTELNGFVFVWYHADDDPPNWSLMSVDNVQNGRWRYMGRTEHTVSCHFQEIPENGADIGHLGVIHADSTVVSNCFATRPKWWRQLLLKINHHTWRAVWDPPEMQPPPKPSHVNNIMLESCTWLFGWCLFRMMLRIQQVGPATVNLVLDACMGGLWRFQGVFVQGVQPLEPFEHRIVHLLFLEDSWFLRLFSKFMLIGEALMVERDVAMWNRKRFLRNPQLVKEERSIVQYRNWFTQFYSESSPTLQSLRDSFDW